MKSVAYAVACRCRAQKEAAAIELGIAKCPGVRQGDVALPTSSLPPPPRACSPQTGKFTDSGTASQISGEGLWVIDDDNRSRWSLSPEEYASAQRNMRDARKKGRYYSQRRAWLKPYLLAGGEINMITAAAAAAAAAAARSPEKVGVAALGVRVLDDARSGHVRSGRWSWTLGSRSPEGFKQ